MLHIVEVIEVGGFGEVVLVHLHGQDDCVAVEHATALKHMIRFDAGIADEISPPPACRVFDLGQYFRGDLPGRMLGVPPKR